MIFIKIIKFLLLTYHSKEPEKFKNIFRIEIIDITENYKYTSFYQDFSS